LLGSDHRAAVQRTCPLATQAPKVPCRHPLEIRRSSAPACNGPAPCGARSPPAKRLIPRPRDTARDCAKRPETRPEPGPRLHRYPQQAANRRTNTPRQQNEIRIPQLLFGPCEEPRKQARAPRFSRRPSVDGFLLRSTPVLEPLTL